jgi:hypothetical protein
MPGDAPDTRAVGSRMGSDRSARSLSADLLVATFSIPRSHAATRPGSTMSVGMPSGNEPYGEVLLEHIRADRYPSVTYMNMLEQITTPRVPVAYTLHLFERIEADKYPSIPMMQRVEGLVGRLGLELPPG